MAQPSGPIDQAPTSPLVQGRLGARLAGSLHRADRYHEVFQLGIVAAARAERGAWGHLQRGVWEVLGGPSPESASPSVWVKLRRRTPKGALPAEVESARLAHARLGRKYKACAKRGAAKKGRRRRRWAALLRLVGMRGSRMGRVITQGPVELTRAFTMRVQREKAWGIGRAQRPGKALPDLDGRARSFALELLMGQRGTPVCLTELRQAVRKASPRLSPSAQQAAQDLEALTEIDIISRDCYGLVTHAMVLGGLMTPGCSSRRQERITAMVERAGSTFATARDKQKAAAGIAALLVLEINDPLGSQTPTGVIEAGISMTRRLGVPPKVLAHVRRVANLAMQPARARAELVHLDHQAGKASSKPLPALSGTLDGPEASTQAERVSSGLYLSSNGTDIEQGWMPLRYQRRGETHERPVTTKNEEGRLLVWLARGRRGRPAGCSAGAGTHLKGALENAGGGFALVGRGADVRLEPLPSVIDPRLGSAPLK